MSIDQLDPKNFDMIRYVPEKSSLHVTSSELVPFLDQQKAAVPNGYSRFQLLFCVNHSPHFTVQDLKVKWLAAI